MDKTNEIVLFETEDKEITLTVPIEQETVWLTQAQMTELYSVDRTVITRHVNNVFKKKELDKESNVQKMHITNADRPVQFYSRDVIISVGYRVKSQRCVHSTVFMPVHCVTCHTENVRQFLKGRKGKLIIKFL